MKTFGMTIVAAAATLATTSHAVQLHDDSDYETCIAKLLKPTWDGCDINSNGIEEGEEF